SSWGYIRRSAQRLLVPWFIFSVFYLAVRWEAERWDVLSQKVVLGEDLLGIVKALYLSTVSSQMYFLLSLFIIRTLAPLTRHIATHRQRSLVLLIFFVSVWIWISPLI